MNCLNKQKNINDCNCSYEPCARKGVCCECLRYHRASSELPACYFASDAEKTYDRSINHFLKVNKNK
ncbi:MAG: DUF6485 family protein [Candidatus Omnitrophica bacterium]|nr:DUF6485 family protein [Candidatus Omnitrophota bacterium]